MTGVLQALSWLLLLGGTAFFVAGTAGLLRFPDVYARLHAVTKADTLGLGLIVLGLCLRADGWQPVLMMLLTWVLVMVSGATACQLLARYAREDPQDSPAVAPDGKAGGAPRVDGR
jgi:multicomponent Na+:H+ antiporter subunit G